MTMQSILSTVVTWAGGAAILVLIVFLVKDVKDLIAGNGSASIGKVVIKILSAFLIIGFMYVALNYEQIGQKTSNIGEAVVDTVVDTAGDMGGN